LLTCFNNYKIFLFLTKTIISIKNIVLIKINKRYINKKFTFLEKYENKIMFK
jgi:hypothetical protein